MGIRKLAAVAAVMAVVFAACGGSAATTAPATAAPATEAPATAAPASEAPASEAPASAAAADCVVGVSWNNYQEERWAKFDEPAIKAARRGRRRQATSRTTPSRRPRRRPATSRT